MSHLLLTDLTIKKALLYWAKKHYRISGAEFSGVVDFVDHDGKGLQSVNAQLDLKEKK